MFATLGYEGAMAAAQEWFASISPIVLLIAGVALALSLAGFGLRVFGVRSAPGESSDAPSGLDTSVR